MTTKVQTFKYRHEYRFIRDFVYELQGLPGTAPFDHIECHKGDVATFDGPNMGRARFYVKSGGTWRLLILKPKQAFALFDEIPRLEK